MYGFDMKSSIRERARSGIDGLACAWCAREIYANYLHVCFLAFQVSVQFHVQGPVERRCTSIEGIVKVPANQRDVPVSTTVSTYEGGVKLVARARNELEAG